MKELMIEELVEFASLEVLAGETGLKNCITDDEILLPGVEFAGFFKYFDSGRIVLIGSKEANFLYAMDLEVQKNRAEELFKRNPRAILFSVNVLIADYFIKLGNKYNIPILRSQMRTTPLTSKIYVYLRNRLAERKGIHGVLVDINGMGTLLVGKSGIGKSEIALELLKRGHQLISDDLVEIYEREVGTIVGCAPDSIRGFLEVRGVGIINAIETFGIGAFREDKTIRLVIELVEWSDDIEYDRLGIEQETATYFHTDIAKLTIPVKTGRNMAVVIESAAMNQKLRYLGYNAALVLSKRISELASNGGEEN